MIHVVAQGECLSTIAARYGFANWRDVDNHPDNVTLRRTRKNPNLLFPGDEVAIPETRPKTLTLATGQRYRFEIRRAKVKIRVHLVNDKGEALEGKRFRLTILGRTVEGMTDGEGLVEAAVPIHVASADLDVWLNDHEHPDLHYELALGDLDPHDAISGLQGRLKNLGYPCTINGKVDEATALAAHAFRARNGLPPAEDPLDDAFRARLALAHDRG